MNRTYKKIYGRILSFGTRFAFPPPV